MHKYPSKNLCIYNKAAQGIFPDISQHDAGTHPETGPGGRTSDTARRARDQDGFARKGKRIVSHQASLA